VDILNILQCTNLGGMEQSALRLMNALRPEHTFRVVSTHPFGPMRPLLDRAGIPAADCSYRGPLGLRSHLELRSRLREVGLQRPIFMTGPTITGLIALPIRRSFPRILMVHFHHRGVHPAWAWRLLYRLALQRFDLVTFPSAFVRDEAMALLPSLRSKSLVLRNVLDMPDLAGAERKALARSRLGIDPSRFTIGNAGWLIPRKRFDVLLDVAAQVRQGVDIQVVVAGGGELRGELESRARDLGLGEQVRFVGWVDRMDDFYQAIDCLVFNTDWDAYPTTPLEAMSYALPVVASAVNSGLGEALVTGTGFLHTTHDVVSMARDIVGLARDPSLREKVGGAARERIRELTSFEYSVAPVVDCLEGRRSTQAFR